MGRTGTLGTKNPASTHEGVKAGLKLNPGKLVSSLIRSMARPLPASHDAGLDERKQAGLLAPRSSYFAGLTDDHRQWLWWHFVARYSGATARDLDPANSSNHTRFPILPKPWLEALVCVTMHN